MIIPALPLATVAYGGLLATAWHIYFPTAALENLCHLPRYVRRHHFLYSERLLRIQEVDGEDTREVFYRHPRRNATYFGTGIFSV